MAKYVYIDESGDFGQSEGSSKHLIITSISTDNTRRLEKLMKKIWRAKPQFHVLGELHAHAVDDRTRRKVLHEISESDCVVEFTVYEKKIDGSVRLDTQYYRILATHIGALGNEVKVIVVDRRDTVAKREKIISNLKLEDVFDNVEFRMSHETPQLQAVDFVSWAIYNKIELGVVEFYQLIEGRIR